MLHTGYKGIILEQNKEPVLSKGIKQLKHLPVREDIFCDMSGVDSTQLTAQEIIAIARDAQIIDECDGRRLWKKLAQALREQPAMIIVDALDDEPYISSQLCMTLWQPHELEQGIGLLVQATGIDNVNVEIYRHIFDVDINIPTGIGPYKVRRVGGTYPAEQQGRRANRRRHALVVGACALVHLERAVEQGRRQSSCFVSVAGDCVANPANYELPLGATVWQILEETGILAAPKRVVVGGSMTGVSVSEPENVTITAATRGILAFAEQFEDMGYTCIGCGRCIDACPQDLSPHYLHKLIRAGKNKRAFSQTKYCTGCGACSYVCPAKLDLVQIIYGSASELKRKGVPDNEV